MRVSYLLAKVLLLLSIIGIASTFAIRIGCAADLLPTYLNADSDLEFRSAQSITHLSGRITEVCWLSYWLLISPYWLLKSFQGIIFDRRADIPFLIPSLVFVLLVTDAFGLRSWMWG